MKRYLFFVIACISTVVILVHCTKKGEAIEEQKFGLYEFRTYTVDTFRFKVILNGEVLTDSLLSPRGSFSKSVKFSKPEARLLVVDAGNNDQTIIDSIIQLKIGSTVISIIQLENSKKPGTPPRPNEPAPAAGNYKLRFHYIKPVHPDVPFFDTIKLVVFTSNAGGYSPIDTVDLLKNGVSPFYEISKSEGFRIGLYEYNSFRRLHSGSTPYINRTLAGEPDNFVTWAFFGVDTSLTTSGRYIFDFYKAY